MSEYLFKIGMTVTFAGLVLGLFGVLTWIIHPAVGCSIAAIGLVPVFAHMIERMWRD